MSQSSLTERTILPVRRVDGRGIGNSPTEPLVATQGATGAVAVAPVQSAPELPEIPPANPLPPITTIQSVVAAPTMPCAVRPPVALPSPTDWHMWNYDQLEQRVSETHSGEFLIEDFISKASLGLLIGDSGLGKSPLLYQASLAVAAGKSFLGHATRQGGVLYLDFENGIADVHGMVRRLASYLGLETVPPNLHLWNFNDCANRYGLPGYTIRDMVLGCRPNLVVIDSLTACYPSIEDKNPTAIKALKELREIMRASLATFLCVHHRRKPSTRPEDAPQPLEDGNVRDWFRQARDPSALINGVDVRIGVDLPRHAILPRDTEAKEEPALVIRGFGRVRGDIGPIYTARALDEEGEPLGYRQIAGAELLFNSQQQATFERLGQVFTFSEAKAAYERQDQATSDLLKKLLRMGLIHKTGRGQYRKTSPAPERAEEAPNHMSLRALAEPATSECDRSSTE